MDMMNTSLDEPKSFNPRPIAAIYFAGITLLFCLLAKYFLIIYEYGSLLPLVYALPMSVLVGGICGALYARRIAAAISASHAFLWGVLLALTIIPVFSLGLQFVYYLYKPLTYANVHQWQDYLVLYGVLVLFVLIIAGIWFIPILGFAAMHFNRRTLPQFRALRMRSKGEVSTHARDGE